VPSASSAASSSQGHAAARGLSADVPRYLYKFWRGLLTEWEAALLARPMDVSSSAQGRADYGAFAQTSEHMAPFFRLCKARTVPPDVAALLAEITTALLRGDYLSAGDAYIRLSIGKAAWTLGVSQVGIHERIARERIYVGKLPHVLNDEVQRKYVTGIKRLMTFMQHTWPPADPSRAVTN
jgi:pre-mRNA-splicing factor 18